MIPSMRGIARMMAGLALALGLTGCGDGSTGPEGPTPGNLTVTLTTPNAELEM